MNSKSIGLSNTMQYILFIISGVILTVILLFLQLQLWLVYVIIIGIGLIFFTIRPMYLIYKSTSIVAMDRYVRNNKKKPLFGYAFALAYGDDEDIEYALKKILDKHKQAEMQTVYGANLALHNKDADTIMEFAQKMTRTNYKDYYLGVAHLMKGDLTQTNAYFERLRTPWMIHSLKASIAIHLLDQEKFQQEAQLSINSATGLQRYILHNMMSRMEKISFPT